MAIAINDVINAFLAMIAIPAIANTARAANFNFNRPNNGNNFLMIFFLVRPSTTNARTDSFTSSGMELARLRPALAKSQLMVPIYFWFCGARSFKWEIELFIATEINKKTNVIFSLTFGEEVLDTIQ